MTSVTAGDFEISMRSAILDQKLPKTFHAPLQGCILPANTLTPGVAKNAPPGAYVPSALQAVTPEACLEICPEYAFFAYSGQTFPMKTHPEEGARRVSDFRFLRPFH